MFDKELLAMDSPPDDLGARVRWERLQQDRDQAELDRLASRRSRVAATAMLACRFLGTVGVFCFVAILAFAGCVASGLDGETAASAAVFCGVFVAIATWTFGD